MIGYSGTGYSGMQIQPDNTNVQTIEGDLFKALVEAGAISQDNANDIKKSGFMRAARTDKGVHAAGNVISLKMIIEDEDILERINAKLPPQIRMWGFERVSKSFDCRKLCSSRVYEYLLPTHCLIPPRPKTSLYELIEKSRTEHPGVLRDDQDKSWWDQLREKILAQGFTEEDYESVYSKSVEIDSEDQIKKDFLDENGEMTEHGQLVRKLRSIEADFRKEYRVPQEKLRLLREAMDQYVGSHVFHNFTLGKSFKDQSARRFMKSTSVSDPFTIEGAEWVSIKIHGQSFMLHQIRKMICMASLVVRTGCPVSRISDCYGPTKINIPKAPALGLLLECPVYEGYNLKQTSMGYNKIDFAAFQKEMDDFKMKNIYDKIYAEEDKEHVFQSFFEFLDTFRGSGAYTDGKHIFDFLGAAFNNESQETEASQSK